MKKYFFIFTLCFYSLSFAAEEAMLASSTSNESTPLAEAAVTNTINDESQIPLKVKDEKKESVQATSAEQIFLGTAIVIILLSGTYFFVKKYSVRNQKTVQHQIKILTQHHMGPKKSLAIIRVAGESILIGVTDHNISMIKSLSLLDEDLPQDVPQKFDQTLFQVSKATEDEFTIRGIQDHVKSKLKDMKGIS